MKEIIPTHVAIIMDGNGRWATKREMKRSAGHEAGFKTLKVLAKHALSRGVKVLSVFAFSTENFKRSDEEVNFLMNLFTTKFKSEIAFFNKNNVKVIFSGRNEPLSKEVIKSMRILEKKTINNTGGILNICLNYGGQSEIVDAAKKIVKETEKGILNIEDLTEKTFVKYLYQNLPPIDYVIRTSGEMRISNFMLYEMSYAEFYFPKTLFPDFDEKEFDKAIKYYNKRDRRFGSVKIKK